MQQINMRTAQVSGCPRIQMALNVRPVCTVCHGPLMLVACLGENPNGPAQRIYRCLGWRSSRMDGLGRPDARRESTQAQGKQGRLAGPVPLVI
jgi:hypothetical protein